MRTWQLRKNSLTPTPDLPVLMGILNVTPDSFSDGGRYADRDAAVKHGFALAAAGAKILDIGGASSRPGAEEVSAEEETERVLPVIEKLVADGISVPLSIDTEKAAVAKAALEAGAEVVNDVSAGTRDDEMLSLVAETGAGVCLMHRLGTPQTMQDAPHYPRGVVEEVYDYLATRQQAAIDAGIARDKISLDVGIGFGKTMEDNIELLRNITQFAQLGSLLLVGHSRKRFIGEFLKQHSPAASLQDDPGDNQEIIDARDAATLGVAIGMVGKSVEILRLHNVQKALEAIKIYSELMKPQ